MHRTRWILVAAASLSIVSCTTVDVKTRVVEYRQGDTPLQGFVAWDPKISGKRPGVLVVHEWWGHNEHAREQARKLARAGYVGFALDLYGKGKVTRHPNEAQAFMAEASKDPAVLAARFDAALAELRRDPHVDPDRIAAIGYCFGGAVVLGMAKAGADLDAVATFHGALTGPPDSGAVKARVLMMAGTADPMVPLDDLDRFEQSMRAAGARIEVIRYPNAQHAFTNPEAGTFGMQGLAYDPKADRESWAALLRMLHEVFP